MASDNRRARLIPAPDPRSHLLRRVGAVLGFFLAGMAIIPAALAQCPQVPPEARNPTVRLDVLEPKLVYRHDVDLFGLGKLRHSFEKAPKGWVMLGVTITSDHLAIQLRPVMLSDAGGRLCVWVSDVEARIGDPELDVYVAANYPEGTCEYTVVRDHENQHVAINRGVIAAWGPGIGARLREIVAQSFPMVLASRADAQRLPNLLLERLQPLLDAMTNELRSRNGAIDTPENYRRTAARCNNWFPEGTRMPER